MSSLSPLTVAVTGASGLVGSELTGLLKSSGDSVLTLTRDDRGSEAGQILWDPARGVLDTGRLENVDAVIHLAGENIAGGRWTSAVKEKIRSSRVDGTRNLVQSFSKLQHPPKTLICASATGYYGERGDQILTEASAAGVGFLPDVCRDWEREAMAAAEYGIRVVCIRIGVVLSPKGGALAKMLLPFKMGLGGIVGSGKQYWSWIGLNDLARVFDFCLRNEEVRGPVNAVSPEALTNYDFTKCVGSVLHRPTVFPLPAFIARLILGEMADDLLLASTRVTPAQLMEHGFRFEQPDLKSCLEHELS
jgi:uncharacterized protein (TIGR01777 family)